MITNVKPVKPIPITVLVVQIQLIELMIIHVDVKKDGSMMELRNVNNVIRNVLPVSLLLIIALNVSILREKIIPHVPVFKVSLKKIAILVLVIINKYIHYKIY